MRGTLARRDHFLEAGSCSSCVYVRYRTEKPAGSPYYLICKKVHDMTKQSSEKRIVVARVLNRYATAPCTLVDWNKPVVTALEEWIDCGPKVLLTGSMASYLRLLKSTAQSA